MDTLKLAWKVLSFYDLTPQTFARLTQTYGLRECGGLTEVDEAEGLQPTLRQQIIRGMHVEADPRIRYYLWHQLMVTRRAQVLRNRGYQTRVQGWLVVVRGGKQTRIVTQPNQTCRKTAQPRLGQSE